MRQLFSNALITISTMELLLLWGDLVEAYHGKASHGDTTEIYAYRLTRYSPLVHGNPKPSKEAAAEIAINAANALCAIAEEFCDHYDCNVEMDGQSLETWCKAHNNWHRDFFDHRCHVHVIHTNKEMTAHGI